MGYSNPFIYIIGTCYLSVYLDKSDTIDNWSTYTNSGVVETDLALNPTRPSPRYGVTERTGLGMKWWFMICITRMYIYPISIQYCLTAKTDNFGQMKRNEISSFFTNEIQYVQRIRKAQMEAINRQSRLSMQANFLLFILPYRKWVPVGGDFTKTWICVDLQILIHIIQTRLDYR